jgi:NAD(P)-dependent dehydrogenase (short-subunit alcohol dehydrogenase family)
VIDFSKKHILIVGGSRGIGAAAAKMAARAGAIVSITYQHNQSAADAVVAEITQAGGLAAAFVASIESEDAINTAVAAAVNTHGPLSGVVVSAGIFEGAPIDEMTLEFWNRTIQINLTGTFLAVKACVPYLKQNHGGSIVIYTSTAGQRGSSVYSAYATSKGGQILFMRSMALELASENIRVNCIAPSWTETEMAAPSLNAIGRESEAARFPLGRIGLPEDVAGATVFLLSDLAQFITGTTVTCDGGRDMRG